NRGGRSGGEESFAVRSYPEVARRNDREVCASYQRRALRGDALDTLRQSQVHGVLRELSFQELLHTRAPASCGSRLFEVGGRARVRDRGATLVKSFVYAR